MFLCCLHENHEELIHSRISKDKLIFIPELDSRIRAEVKEVLPLPLSRGPGMAGSYGQWDQLAIGPLTVISRRAKNFVSTSLTKSSQPGSKCRECLHLTDE